MARIHDTVSGHRIEFPDPDPKLARFLRKVQETLDDKKTTEDDLTALIYGSENPILDHGLVPGRATVTRDVFDNPVYHVLSDLLWRKGIQQRGIDVEKVAKRYTLTVKEAGELCGISPGAVRQAIHARRVASWVKDGEYFLDPNGLTPLQRSAKRGPMPAIAEPLTVRAGGGKEQLHIHHPGGLLPEKARDTIETTIPRWRRVAVLTAGDSKLRMYVIEPSEEPNEINFYAYHVKGNFKIVEKFNSPKAAREAWEAFQAL